MVATRKWTVEELEALPPEGSWELIDGEMIEMTPSGAESGNVAGRIAALVGGHILASGLGEPFSAETGYRPDSAQETLRAPDFSFVRADRLRAAGVAGARGFLHIAPDLAVEVLSPSDSRTAAFAKCVWWLEAGVSLVWLADPERRTVTVWTPDDAPRTLHDGDTLDGGGVLPGLAVPVAAVFAGIGDGG